MVVSTSAEWRGDGDGIQCTMGHHRVVRTHFVLGASTARRDLSGVTKPRRGYFLYHSCGCLQRTRLRALRRGASPSRRLGGDSSSACQQSTDLYVAVHRPVRRAAEHRVVASVCKCFASTRRIATTGFRGDPHCVGEQRRTKRCGSLRFDST